MMLMDEEVGALRAAEAMMIVIKVMMMMMIAAMSQLMVLGWRQETLNLPLLLLFPRRMAKALPWNQQARAKIRLLHLLVQRLWFTSQAMLSLQMLVQRRPAAAAVLLRRQNRLYLLLLLALAVVAAAKALLPPLHHHLPYKICLE